MSRRALSPCSTPGCPELTKRGRCDTCKRKAEQDRGTAAQRGYDAGHQRFQRLVLRRDPICMRCTAAPSTVADHYPLSRRELVARKLNPNDPARGRGLCHRCHSIETAAHQPGGWHAK